MRSFGQHSLAAALCIEMRGRFQFKTEAAVRLFLQMRRIIVRVNNTSRLPVRHTFVYLSIPQVQTCHQLQEPIPYALQRWSTWAETKQPEDEFYSNRFSEINERLANYRAAIRHDRITCPSTISSKLLQFDEEFENWRRNLPPTWGYKSYRSVDNINDGFNGEYDMYPDLWIASTWNSYRSVRLMLHEALVVATLQHGSDKEKNNLGYSMSVLGNMSKEIWNSCAYFLGHRRQGTRLCGPADDGISPTPGGYMVLWPLFLSGMLRTTRGPQRRWVTSVIRRIGRTMGIHLAITMANVLDAHEKSFSDEEVWLIGQFYPHSLNG